MKRAMSYMYDNRNWEADYWKGVLILTDLESMDYYSIQLKDTKTGHNITWRHFKECVEKYGLDRACETFKKLSAEWLASQVHPNNLKLNLSEVA